MVENVEDFVSRTQILIAKEREAEIAETRLLHENVPPKLLERRGVCLLRLKIASRRTGLYGRTVLEFEAEKEMPSHNFSSGDIVGLSLSVEANLSDSIASGIVSRVTQTTVCVAFDEANENFFELDDTANYKIVKLANDVTYRRIHRALTDLGGGRGNNQLVNVLFGLSDISLPLTLPDLIFFNESLDDSQKDAVKFALSQREIAIIHGPPGTGKTTTVTELIRQAVKSGLKVLACAPSNIAVDNLVEKLSSGGVAKIVRLGHPARLLPTIQRHSLDAIVASSDETKLVEDVRKDIDKTLGQLKKVRDRGDRQRLYKDIKSLRRELRQRESTAVSDILTRASVVLATLTTAADEGPLSYLGQQHLFDVVVIDECSQAMEAACWIALLKGNRCILAGDHNQLPPTILSTSAAKEGLAVTLMERLLNRHKGNEDKVVRMLTTQYRMHDDIMRWSSEQMYQGRLVSHPSVATHLLKDLPGVSETDDTRCAMLLIDTTGCSLNELDVADNESKGNEGEANVVSLHVNNLIASGLSADDIAVISPYNLQVELLRLRLSHSHPRLEIRSVDGFQGREKEAVVLSLVRSNSKGEVGFLAEDRRINVAVTRARRHLAVVCDTETVSHHAFIKSLVDHISSFGEVRSAVQYIQDEAFNSFCPSTEKLELKYRMAPSDKEKTSKKAKSSSSSSSATTVVKPVVQSKPHDTTSDSKPSQKTRNDGDNAASDRLRKILSDFLNDQANIVYSFPCTLSSYERMLVHELAEELKLVHVSKGEASERYIEVSKRHTSVPSASISDVSTQQRTSNVSVMTTVEPQQTAVVVSDDSGSTERPATSDIRTESVTATDQFDHNNTTIGARLCNVCGKDVPISNWQLHSVRCKKLESSFAAGAAASSQSSTSANETKKSKKTKANKSGDLMKSLPSVSADSTDENFDALLAAVTRADKTCFAPKCKNSTATLGQTCTFCRHIFCLSHHQAEVHGCGDEARRHARASLAREGKLYPGSGVPSKKPDPMRRAQLESKLSNRLNDMADKRKKKSKDKDNQ